MSIYIYIYPATTACQGMEVEIINTVTSTFEVFSGISCIGPQSCQDAWISILNQNPNFMYIQNLDCPAFQSCQRTEFILDNVGFENCKCGSATQQSCDGTIGIDSCFEGLEKMECTGPNSCRGQTKTLRNVANDFELVCGDISSCQNFTLNVDLTANNPAGEVTF